METDPRDAKCTSLRKERVDRELPAGQKSPLVAYAAAHASVFTAECVNVNPGKDSDQW